MSRGGTVVLKDKNLRALIAAFKSVPTIRVGVLGGKVSRHQAGPSNAEIGAAHEFGTEKVPVRSFLRQPISEHLDSYMKASGAFNVELLKEVIRTKGLVPYCRKIATLCEQVVGDAFNTGGFGKWQPSNMDRKKVKQTLVETQQLRNAITSEVVTK